VHPGDFGGGASEPLDDLAFDKEPPRLFFALIDIEEPEFRLQRKPVVDLRE